MGPTWAKNTEKISHMDPPKQFPQGNVSLPLLAGDTAEPITELSTEAVSTATGT